MNTGLPPVCFYSRNTGPELAYAWHILFEILLGIPYKRVDEINSTASFLICYSENQVENQTRWIYNSGFLNKMPETRIEPDCLLGEVPLLFPTPSHIQGAMMPFDLPAAIFYFASLYSHYSPSQKDEHERIKEADNFIFKNSLHQKPLLHLYAKEFRKKLIENGYPNFEMPGNFSVQYTMDVDNPWKYLNKGFLINLGGAMRDLLTGKIQLVKNRIRILVSKKDPFFTFPFMASFFKDKNAKFFFLVAHHSPNDGRFNLNNSAYRNLINKWVNEWKMHAGIHPSYTSSTTPNRIAEEKAALEKWAGPITDSRQHYLRFQLPSTFREIIKAGIQNEYSICSRSQGGFVCGLAISFPWFDIEKREMTDLMLHPAQVMDRSFLQEMKTGPKEAMEKVLELAEQVKEVNGNFILILHNETFSNFGEWAGWKSHWLETITALDKLQS